MRTFHPSQPSVGNNVSATLIRQLIADIRASRVIPGPGVTVRRTPQGTHVSAGRKVRPSKGYRPFVPWDFVTKIDENTGEETKEWKNKAVQFGNTVFEFDITPFDQYFQDDTDHEDGSYYLEMKLDLEGQVGLEKATLKTGTVPQIDWDEGKLYSYIGTVEDGRLVRGIGFVPVFFLYL